MKHHFDLSNKIFRSIAIKFAVAAMTLLQIGCAGAQYEDDSNLTIQDKYCQALKQGHYPRGSGFFGNTNEQNYYGPKVPTRGHYVKEKNIFGQEIHVFKVDEYMQRTPEGDIVLHEVTRRKADIGGGELEIDTPKAVIPYGVSPYTRGTGVYRRHGFQQYGK